MGEFVKSSSVDLILSTWNSDKCGARVDERWYVVVVGTDRYAALIRKKG